MASQKTVKLHAAHNFSFVFQYRQLITVDTIASPLQRKTNRRRRRRQRPYLPFTLSPPCYQYIDKHSQYRRPRLRKPNIPTRTLYITIFVKIHLARELLLYSLRQRAARPAPQIITLAIFILLIAIYARSHAPHHDIRQHNCPREQRGDLRDDVCAAHTRSVAEDGGEVEERGHHRDAEVGVRGPQLGVVRPGRAGRGGAVRVRDGAVGVACLQELYHCHGDGDQDADGD